MPPPPRTTMRRSSKERLRLEETEATAEAHKGSMRIPAPHRKGPIKAWRAAVRSYIIAHRESKPSDTKIRARNVTRLTHRGGRARNTPAGILQRARKTQVEGRGLLVRTGSRHAWLRGGRWSRSAGESGRTASLPGVQRRAGVV